MGHMVHQLNFKQGNTSPHKAKPVQRAIKATEEVQVHH